MDLLDRLRELLDGPGACHKCPTEEVIAEIERMREGRLHLMSEIERLREQKQLAYDEVALQFAEVVRLREENEKYRAGMQENCGLRKGIERLRSTLQEARKACIAKAPSTAVDLIDAALVAPDGPTPYHKAQEHTHRV